MLFTSGKFKSYEDIRREEVVAGHDYILASAVSFCNEAEDEDGCALFLGQSNEDGGRCFLCVDRNGFGTLVDGTSGSVLKSYFQLEEAEQELSKYSWLVSLE